MNKFSGLTVLVLFLTSVAFLFVSSVTLSLQTVIAQNMTVTTGNATTGDNATGADNATGSISRKAGGQQQDCC
jgi:hypothetical protein